MITSKFINRCLINLDFLSLGYKTRLSKELLKETFARELYSDNGYFLLGAEAYRFLVNNIDKVNKAMEDRRWNQSASILEIKSNKANIKIKDKSLAIVTNIFNNKFEIITIDENNKLCFEPITDKDIKESRKSKKEYKTFHDDDGVTYIFEKEYFNSHKNNLDGDKAVGFYTSLISKDYYLYSVYPNIKVSKSKALESAVRLETLKHVTSLIAIQCITNTFVMNSILR